MSNAPPNLSLFSIWKVAAGVVKVFSEPLQGTSLARAVLAAVACAEIGLGLWLLVGACTPRARRVALLAFSGLFGAALLAAFRGDISCRCFGEISISPWWMVTLDGALVAAFLAMPTESSPACPRHRGVLTACAAAVCAGLARAYGSHLAFAPEAAPEGAAILTASTWEQHAHRIFEDAENGEDLRRGEWLVLLHRRGCRACGEALAKCRELAKSGAAARVAVIDLPDAEGDTGAALLAGTRVTVSRLRHGREWVVQAPFFLWLREGSVARGGTQLPS